MSNGFKIGDVIHNGWAGEDNCYSIIIGRGSIKNSKFTSTSTYKHRTLFRGKLAKHIGQMDIKADKQTKIGHVDYEGIIEAEMLKIIATTTDKPVINKGA